MNATTAITENLSFKEKLMERIRDSIGDLISDDDLKNILEAGVDSALFERREIKDDYGRIKTIPSLVDEAVSTHIKERLDARVKEWLLENPEKLEQAVNEAVTDGLGKILVQSVSNMFRNELYNFQASIETRLRAGS
jgi:uncharacterized hydantoinase/oxoprolinase family protein